MDSKNEDDTENTENKKFSVVDGKNTLTLTGR